MSSSAIAAQAVAPQIRTEVAWYCLWSVSKHEHIVAAHLLMLEAWLFSVLRSDLSGRLGEAWSGSLRQFSRASCLPASIWRNIAACCMLRVFGSIVRFGNRYPSIGEQSLGQLRDQTGVTEIREVNCEISQGDRVKIARGVFVGLEAVVTQVVPATQRVKFLLDFLSRKMEAEVECASVLPRVAHPLAA